MLLMLTQDGQWVEVFVNKFYNFFQVIVKEASKNIQDVGKGWKPTAHAGEVESMSRAGSLNEGPAVFKSPSKSWKVIVKLLQKFFFII